MEREVLFALLFVLVLVSAIIWWTRPRRRKKLFLQFSYLGNDFNYPQVKSKKMAINFKANQFARVQVQTVDRKGNPTPVQEGTIDYSSPDPSFTVTEDPNDETILTITSSADVVTESKVVDIEVSADADRGDGVKTIHGVITCVLEPEMAEGFGINVLEAPQDVQ